MEELTQEDFQAILECLQDMYSHLDFESFPTQFLSSLRKVLPAEVVGYNEVYPLKRKATALIEPAGVIPAEGVEVFAQLMHEHPVLDYHRRTGEGQALRISDFLPRRQFHRLALYKEFYQGVGIEYQMAIALHTPGPPVIGISLSRDRRDFSERDRLLLNLLRPHLVQAYHNAQAFTRMLQELDQLRQAMEGSDQGVILVSPEGRIRLMTKVAREWVEEYFGKCPGCGRLLPEGLRHWVARHHSSFASDGEALPPRAPLVVRREGRRLVVRLVPDRCGGECLLLRQEVQVASSPALESLGLSRREAEVLFWVAQGKTNPEVAVILGLSPRTIEKNLERTYPKLGVDNRAAATMQALETLGLLRWEPPAADVT